MPDTLTCFSRGTGNDPLVIASALAEPFEWIVRKVAKGCRLDDGTEAYVVPCIGGTLIAEADPSEHCTWVPATMLEPGYGKWTPGPASEWSLDWPEDRHPLRAIADALVWAELAKPFHGTTCYLYADACREFVTENWPEATVKDESHYSGVIEPEYDPYAAADEPGHDQDRGEA